MEGLPASLQQVDRTFVLSGRKKLTYFGGCDYFRISSHPRVLETIEKSLKTYGLNVAASRATTGNHRVYEELEAELANFFNAPTATLTSSGYMSNMVVAQALAGNFSHVAVDEKAHGSLWDAAHYFDCPVFRYSHLNVQELVSLLRQTGSCHSPVLLTDGIFANDGTMPPLAAYLEVLPEEGFLLVDDAHAAGVIGQNGRGSVEESGLDRRRVIQTITLSKAFGVYGGAVLGPDELRRKIIARSRLFIGNTPLPLPLAAAAITSVQLLRSTPQFLIQLKANTAYIKESLDRGGVQSINNNAPILSFVPETPKEGSRLKKQLLARGIHPPLIRYPGGPAAGYFRFAISSEHTRAQLDSLIEALIDWRHNPEPSGSKLLGKKPTSRR